MSIIDEENDQTFDKVRGILGEHFPNFLFAVMDDEGMLFYDYTNLPIGKMLIREMSSEMKDGFDDINFDFEWEAADDEETDEWN